MVEVGKGQEYKRGREHWGSSGIIYRSRNDCTTKALSLRRKKIFTKAPLRPVFWSGRGPSACISVLWIQNDVRAAVRKGNSNLKFVAAFTLQSVCVMCCCL